MNNKTYCFYVVFFTQRGMCQVLSYRIIDTEFNLNDANDLKEWINIMEQEMNKDIIVLQWKELNNNE